MIATVCDHDKLPQGLAYLCQAARTCPDCGESLLQEFDEDDEGGQFWLSKEPPAQVPVRRPVVAENITLRPVEAPDGPVALVVTKAELRAVIAEIIQSNRAAGVPEEGIAEILAQWVSGHLSIGTKVVPTPPLASVSTSKQVASTKGST